VSYTLQFKNQSVDPVGKSPVNVPVGTVNTTSTSLALTGKGASNFGKFQQENLLRLLECFADTAAPTNPTVGQLWYDSANLTLKVLTDASPQTWKSLGGVQVTAFSVPPAPPPLPAALGDLWFERTGTASGFLYVYTGIGRYPTTATTIGGWDQIWPQVEIFGGREEYDLVRQIVDQICGSSVSAFGSGAIGRSIQNLTDFGALDLDLRTKFKALGADANILFSPNIGLQNVDREITRQAVSTTLFYFNDAGNPGDGFIGGPTANPAVLNVNGTIYIDGVLTAVPASVMFHGVSAVDDAFIIWDRTNTLVSSNQPSNMFVARQLDSGQWEYDNNAAWVAFTPVANMYAIGTISGQADNTGNLVYPVDRASFMWVHAVPLIGTKYEHLKVEPNSQDWDVLLAAAKYALNRLEVPSSFVGAISAMPFVGDGRAPHPTLIGLNSQSDPRFPSAARRSNRRSSAIRQVQSFSETVNAMNVAIANRFSIQGINGFTGTFPYFKSTTSVAVHGTSSGNVPSGTGSFRVQFRFNSMDEMNRFLGSGGALQFELTHVGGAGPGDGPFSTLLQQAGTWRLSADRTRIFGQSSPLTISQPTTTSGIWNGNSVGTLLSSVTIASNTLSFYAWRVSNTQFDIQILFTSQAMAGTTSVSFSTISDNETYLNPGATLVYPKPLPFVVGDVVDPF
jgi:hypothetical protein